jgi:hypothetical protein
MISPPKSASALSIQCSSDGRALLLTAHGGRVTGSRVRGEVLEDLDVVVGRRHVPDLLLEVPRPVSIGAVSEQEADLPAEARGVDVRFGVLLGFSWVRIGSSSRHRSGSSTLIPPQQR